MLGCASQIPGDLFGAALDDDTPANAQFGVPIVHFERNPGLRDRVELDTRSGAEHDDSAFHGIVDRKDLRLTTNLERYPAQVARSEQKQAFIWREYLDRLIRQRFPAHSHSMGVKQI